MSSIWIGLAIFLSSWTLIAVTLGVWTARWMGMQKTIERQAARSK